jgi:hypothetical protein
MFKYNILVDENIKFVKSSHIKSTFLLMCKLWVEIYTNY